MDITKAQMDGRSIKIKNIGMKSIYKTVITDAVTANGQESPRLLSGG